MRQFMMALVFLGVMLVGTSAWAGMVKEKHGWPIQRDNGDCDFPPDPDAE